MSSTTFVALQSAAKQGKSAPDKPCVKMRCHVLHLGVLVGNLCSAILTNAPLDPKREPLEDVEESELKGCESSACGSIWNPSTREHEQRRAQVANALGELLWAFVVASEACSMDLYTCIVKKLKLNEKKYPVELCKGKSGKYTAYSNHTGITKTKGQSTLHMNDATDESAPSVEATMLKIRAFAMERLWSRYHTPRSLVLALMGELGELAELFQWRGDHSDKFGCESWSKEDLDHVGQELADVSIYLLRLADVCGIRDIGERALQLASSEREA